MVNLNSAGDGGVEIETIHHEGHEGSRRSYFTGPLRDIRPGALELIRATFSEGS